ncbi:prepilin-type N-terminal cleavage/methylation domain-containing protein [Patescibacteria group bacterium]
MKHHDTQSGYTLVEAIVSIAILTAGLLGIITVATQSVRVSDISESKLQAEYLAQEGIELMRAMREANSTYFHDVGDPATLINYYDLKQPSSSFDEEIVMNVDADGNVCFESGFSGTNCDAEGQMYIDATGKYVLDSVGDASKYSRLITLVIRDAADTDDTTDSYLEVTSTVSFQARGFSTPSEYSITTHLYDWL